MILSCNLSYIVTYSDPYMHLYPTRCADHACPVLFGLISYIVSSMHPRLRSNPHPSKNYENTKWNYNIYLHIYIYIFIQFGYILWINGTCSSRWITLGISDSYQWIESWLYMFLSKRRMIKIKCIHHDLRKIIESHFIAIYLSPLKLTFVMTIH